MKELTSKIKGLVKKANCPEIWFVIIALTVAVVLCNELFGAPLTYGTQETMKWQY